MKRNHWIHLPLVELYDVAYYCDFEIWVRGHWRSLKLVPFESLGTVFYSPSIVRDILGFSVHRGMHFIGRWRWRYSRPNYGAILYRLRDIATDWSKNREIFIPHLYLSPPHGLILSEFREDVWLWLSDWDRIAISISRLIMLTRDKNGDELKPWSQLDVLAWCSVNTALAYYV